MKTFPINATANCKTATVVYVIKCLKWNKHYVGEPENALYIWMNGHQSDIKHQRLEKPVTNCYNSEGHSLEDHCILWSNRPTGRKQTFAKQKKATGFRLFDRWPLRDWTSIHRPLKTIDQRSEQENLHKSDGTGQEYSKNILGMQPHLLPDHKPVQTYVQCSGSLQKREAGVLQFWHSTMCTHGHWCPVTAQITHMVQIYFEVSTQTAHRFCYCVGCSIWKSKNTEKAGFNLPSSKYLQYTMSSLVTETFVVSLIQKAKKGDLWMEKPIGWEMVSPKDGFSKNFHYLFHEPFRRECALPPRW